MSLQRLPDANMQKISTMSYLVLELQTRIIKCHTPNQGLAMFVKKMNVFMLSEWGPDCAVLMVSV